MYLSKMRYLTSGKLSGRAYVTFKTFLCGQEFHFSLDCRSYRLPCGRVQVIVRDSAWRFSDDSHNGDIVFNSVGEMFGTLDKFGCTCCDDCREVYDLLGVRPYGCK